jgi:hypothetical protein
MKEDIKSLFPEELRGKLSEMGEAPYRAEQVFKWLHRAVRSFSEMTDLSKALREKLDEAFYIASPEAVRKQISQEDGTVKYLWRLSDGNTVESVVMRYEHGNTVCISSQVGCRMGCRFCASTIGGLVRNLAPSELLDQVLFSQLDSGLKLSNIVLMGIGEPLDNYDNVRRFLGLVSAPLGVNIGIDVVDGQREQAADAHAGIVGSGRNPDLFALDHEIRKPPAGMMAAAGAIPLVVLLKGDVVQFTVEEHGEHRGRRIRPVEHPAGKGAQGGLDGHPVGDTPA